LLLAFIFIVIFNLCCVIYFCVTLISYFLDGMQRRYEKAMHYFELAASENDWQAIFQLGVMYFDGIHCEPDMVRI